VALIKCEYFLMALNWFSVASLHKRANVSPRFK